MAGKPIEHRPSLAELASRCHKPEHPRVGNWMARRVSRPMALRITWLVAPWGVSANAATSLAWITGLAGALLLGTGTHWGWFLGAVALQLWYLLDHVDGQLARLRGTDSLDGKHLDYLMHHCMNIAVPLGVGAGVVAATGQVAWLIAAGGWALAAMLLTVQHDARYKTLIARLERVEGKLFAVGQGHKEPEGTPPIPRSPLRLASWAAHKLAEAHVVIGVVLLLAILQWLANDRQLVLARGYLLAMAIGSVAAAGWDVVKSQHHRTAEAEFQRWFRVPQGYRLVPLHGKWRVVSNEPAEPCDGEDTPLRGSLAEEIPCCSGHPAQCSVTKRQ